MEVKQAVKLLRELAAELRRRDPVLSPTLPGLRAMSRVNYRGSSDPYLLTCTFEPRSAPTLSELVAGFGAAQALPTDRGAPRAVQFGEVTRTRPSVVLIAELPELPPGVVSADDLPVTSVTLRRDRD